MLSNLWFKKQVCFGKGYVYVQYLLPTLMPALPTARIVQGGASFGKTSKLVHCGGEKAEGFAINTLKADIWLRECHRKSQFLWLTRTSKSMSM